MSDEQRHDSDVVTPAEVDAMLSFLEKCAEAFLHADPYTNAPRISRYLDESVALLREHGPGPGHARELARMVTDLAGVGAELK